MSTAPKSEAIADPDNIRSEPPAFSPGPWTAQIFEGSRVVVCDAHGYIIAFVYATSTVADERGVRPQAEHNAALMAHAPQMLKLVRLLAPLAALELHEPDNYVRSSGLADVVDIAVEVLASLDMGA